MSAVAAFQNGKVVALIRERMNDLGLRQIDLGRVMRPDAKNPAAYCSNWINGQTPVPFKVRPLLAKVLGIDIALLEPEKIPTSAPRISLPAADRSAPARPVVPPKSPLSFQITAEGRVKISLDVDLPIEQGKSLLRVLLDIDSLTKMPEAE